MENFSDAFLRTVLFRCLNRHFWLVLSGKITAAISVLFCVRNVSRVPMGTHAGARRLGTPVVTSLHDAHPLVRWASSLSTLSRLAPARPSSGCRAAEGPASRHGRFQWTPPRAPLEAWVLSGEPGPRSCPPGLLSWLVAAPHQPFRISRRKLGLAC